MHKIFAKYLSDESVSACTSDENFIRKMLDTEIALAKVQAQLGIIPKTAAQEIETALKKFNPEPELLATGTMENGIPTIPLLALAKKQLSSTAQDYLHWGATSQDIIDTAQVLMIKEVLPILKERLAEIIKNLKQLAQKHHYTYTVARTRTQQAIPITFGQKVENWWQPLERHQERLAQLTPRLLVVQLGGAGGNLAALGTQGTATAQALAKALHLNYAGVWHSQRDNLAEFASWLALLAGSLGKMAQDILLLSQTEIGEVIENAKGGGRSSTMPHKHNPVLSEAIVALSRHVGQLAGNHFQALLHQHERDGAAWALEWLTLPSMIVATGTCLNHALTISNNIEVNEKAMQTNLEKLHGLVFSEKASFLLTDFMSRGEAKQVVDQACQLVVEEGISLTKALEKLTPDIDIDWNEALKL